MSPKNRHGKAAGSPNEQSNGGGSSSPPRELSKASNGDRSQSHGTRKSHPTSTSASPALKSFAQNEFRASASSSLAASPSARGATQPPMDHNHREGNVALADGDETTAGGASSRLRSMSPSQESDIIENGLTSGVKRSKLPLEAARKRSKHSAMDKGDLTPDSGYPEEMEIEVEPSNSGGEEVDNGAEDESEEEQEDDKKLEAKVNQALPYRSIKTIKVPKRSNQDNKGTDVDRQPQEKDPTTWYGTLQYRDSLIMYFCDEVGMSYNKTRNEAAILQTFPGGEVSSEWIRKRHLRSLYEQFKQYGLKDKADIPVPTAAESRRGIPRAPNKVKSQAGVDETVSSLIATAQVSAQPSEKQIEPRFVREAPARQLEMTAIVVWKDLYDFSFEKIRSMLKVDFEWIITPEQVENFYHVARPSAYGSKGHVEDQEDAPDQQDVPKDEGV